MNKLDQALLSHVHGKIFRPYQSAHNQSLLGLKKPLNLQVFENAILKQISSLNTDLWNIYIVLIFSY